MKKKFLINLSITLLLLATVFGFLPSVKFEGTQVSAQSQEKRWIVIFHNQNSIPQDADGIVAQSGGRVISNLSEIGVLVAVSNDPNFASRIARNNKVSDVVEDVEVQLIPPPGKMKIQAINEATAAGDGPVEAPGDDTQTNPTEPFYRFQWDKKRMRASLQGSYSVQRGRREVVVAVLDTGADILPVPHQDIAPNLDFARSRSFVNPTFGINGDPNPAAWDDKNGHGSWCLSAVGAPINGRGISGVAPNVTMVALKVLNDSGSGSYVSIAQALIYAGINRFDVASMSLGGYLRRSDQASHAQIKLLQRAINFARGNGVTPIAALGNDGFDVSDGSFMRDFIHVPSEIDGVIGVSATGYFNLKASYSNYGVGKTDISAPGGDGYVQTTSPAIPVGAGDVLGAWAQEVFGPNAYAFTSGTSMATPNAAGVTALIISQNGDFTPDGSRKLHMSPQRVEAYLQQSANNQPCPEPREVSYFLISPPFPPNTLAAPPNQRCQGNAGHNNFFGKGMVDAYKAVTQAPGQN